MKKIVLTQQQDKSVKNWRRTVLYATALSVLYVGASWASFETQLGKASDLTLGKIAGLILGGGAIIGGGLQVKDGNVMRGLGIMAVVGMIGLVIALIKSGDAFKILG